MSEFDPLRAQRELVTGLREVHQVLAVRAREAQGMLAKYEAEANALMKLERFTEGHLQAAVLKLRTLEEAAQ